MKIHRFKTPIFVSFPVVGAIARPYVGRAPTAHKIGAISNKACSFVYLLIENYHFFTTQITTYGASAIRKRVYICY